MMRSRSCEFRQRIREGDVRDGAAILLTLGIKGYLETERVFVVAWVDREASFGVGHELFRAHVGRP